MSWQSVTVSNLQQLESVNQAACEWFRAGKMVDVKVRESGLSRLDAMKALQHHWYNELARQKGTKPESMRNFCKLVFGVPIARKDEGFRRAYDQVLKHLSPTQKMYFMGPPMSISVTSNFNTKQMHQYLNAIKAWADKKGYTLTTSNDLYVKAMGV